LPLGGGTRLHIHDCLVRVLVLPSEALRDAGDQANWLIKRLFLLLRKFSWRWLKLLQIAINFDSFEAFINHNKIGWVKLRAQFIIVIFNPQPAEFGLNIIKADLL
jgi:hypothetical protein